MKRHNSRYSDNMSETTMITLFIVLMLIIGGVAGWSARTVYSRDRNVIAQAEKAAAETNYYERLVEAQVDKKGDNTWQR